MTRTPHDDAAQAEQAYPQFGTAPITIDLRGLDHTFTPDGQLQVQIPLIDNNGLVERLSNVAEAALPDEDRHQQDNLANLLAETIYRTQIERFFLRRIKER